MIHINMHANRIEIWHKNGTSLNGMPHSYVLCQPHFKSTVILKSGQRSIWRRWSNLILNNFEHPKTSFSTNGNKSWWERINVDSCWMYDYIVYQGHFYCLYVAKTQFLFVGQTDGHSNVKSKFNTCYSETSETERQSIKHSLQFLYNNVGERKLSRKCNGMVSLDSSNWIGVDASPPWNIHV